MISAGLAALATGLLGAGASIFGAKTAADASKAAAANAAAVQMQGQNAALGAYNNALGFQKEALATQQLVLGNQFKNYDIARRDFEDSREQARRLFDTGQADAREYFRTSQDNFNATRGNLDPWIQSGMGANKLLSSFYGLGGADQALGNAVLARFQQSPDYQFALRGGTEALDNSASARGGLLSGNQLRAVTEYGQGLASQNLGQYLQRLGIISNTGLGASGQLGQFGAQQGALATQFGLQQAAAGNQFGFQQGALGNQFANLGTTLGNGAAGAIGNTAGGIANAANNFGNSMINSSNSIGNSEMAGGTAEASGILGMVKGFNSGLGSLSLYNSLGKTSYGGGMGNPMTLGGLY